jgi:hypothetical protein
VTHVQAMAPSATRALYPHGACPDPRRGAHTSCSWKWLKMAEKWLNMWNCPRLELKTTAIHITILPNSGLPVRHVSLQVLRTNSAHHTGQSRDPPGALVLQEEGAAILRLVKQALGMGVGHNALIGPLSVFWWCCGTRFPSQEISGKVAQKPSSAWRQSDGREKNLAATSWGPKGAPEVLSKLGVQELCEGNNWRKPLNLMI